MTGQRSNAISCAYCKGVIHYTVVVSDKKVKERQYPVCPNCGASQNLYAEFLIDGHSN